MGTGYVRLLEGRIALRHTHDWDKRRAAMIQVVAWMGLLAPLAIAEARPGSAILQSPFTPVTVFRGAFPALALLALVALTRSLPIPSNLGERLLAAYLGVALLSSLWSVAPAATLLKAGLLIVLYMILFFLVRSWRDMQQAIAQLSVVIYALIASALIGGLLAPATAFSPEDRLFGIVPPIHAFPLGNLAAAGVVLAVVGPWRGKGQILSARLGLFAGSAWVLLLTRTRSSAVFAIVGISVALVAQRKFRLLTAGLVLATLVIATLLRTPGIRAPLTDAVLRGQPPATFSSLGYRIPLWELAMREWQERPLIGYGYYSGHRYGPYREAVGEWALDVSGENQIFARERVENAYVDGAYIETLLDLGVLGALPLVGFVMTGLLGLARMSVRRATAAAAGGSLAVVLFLDSLMSYSLQVPSYQGIVFAGILLVGIYGGSRLAATRDSVDLSEPHSAGPVAPEP